MTAVRVPQEQRSRLTRQRLLVAAVECLVDHGYAGTSTTLVSERAGVSRGAQLHHYPSKADLVLAAVRHLSEQRGVELRRVSEELPRGEGRTEALLAVLGEHLTGPLFAAALELWVAARTDEQLRAEVQGLEQEMGRQIHRTTVALLGVDESRPGARELVQATLDLLRGLGLATTLGDDTQRRRRILAHWAGVLDRELAA